MATTAAAAAAAVFSASVRGAEHLCGKLRCLCIYANMVVVVGGGKAWELSALLLCRYGYKDEDIGWQEGLMWHPSRHPSISHGHRDSTKG